MQFIRVLHCKLPTNSKQLPAFPLETVQGTEPQPQRWEARVLPLCQRGPHIIEINFVYFTIVLIPGETNKNKNNLSIYLLMASFEMAIADEGRIKRQIYNQSTILSTF